MIKCITIRDAIEIALVNYDCGSYICHGPGRCEMACRTSPKNCHWCHLVRVGDARTIDETDDDIERQQRGH